MSQTQVSRAESLDEQDPNKNQDGDKKPKSRRPANTAFRQQRLKAWQPILTPKTVLPLFFAVGIIFAPIGGLLLWASSQVQELVIDYSLCREQASEDQVNPNEIPLENIHSSFKSSNPTSPATWSRRSENLTNSNGIEIPTTTCSLIFDLPNNLDPPVFLYYRLTNFYQNHRRYVKSLDIEQMKGEARSNGTIAGGTCDPLRINPDNGKAYYPCGLIANSVFNDSFTSPDLLTPRDSSKEKETYSMTNKGIAWETDKELYKPTKYKPDEIWPPPNWEVRYPNGYTEDNPPPNLQDDEEFQVWMRTAGLPTFSKLARRNDVDPMLSGTYKIEIQDHFPVTKYGGTKSIVISTRTVMGGKNPFMGIAYIVVGGICVILGLVFTVAHLVKPRKLGDHTYLTWNNEEPSTGTSTGRDNRYGSTAQ
ncbi:hypothetical protein FQN54_005804 [Arachnomyces sp. PD_36]|nr:hypothetical protein FQN54_005804 [Arachnomyces sp. PD_36]